LKEGDGHKDVYAKLHELGFKGTRRLGPELSENAELYHMFLYDHLLPSIDDCLIDYADEGNNFTKTELLNKTVAQVSESRNQILRILKGCILEYRLYLNQNPDWIQAIVDFVTFVLQSNWTAMRALLDMFAHIIKVLAMSIGILFLTVIDLTISHAGIAIITMGVILTVVGAILIPVGGVGLTAGGGAMIVAGAGLGAIGSMEFRWHILHGDSPQQFQSRLIIQRAQAWLEAQL